MTSRRTTEQRRQRKGPGEQSATSRAADVGGPETMLLTPRGSGMFATVHNVAEHARLAAADGRAFVVRWPKSPYKDSERVGNPWRYYFQPVFPGATLGSSPPNARKFYPNVRLSSESMFNPRLIAGVRDTMALPTDRTAAGAVLDRFIRLNRTTQAFIDDFATAFFTRPVIGLHLRGPGRVHGGAFQLRQMLKPDGSIPYDHYFAAVDAALEQHPDALVFGCTDSLQVVDRIRERYGDRALFYPSSRSDFGEMHDKHPENEGQEFSPYKLGLDVVVEAHLLTRCTHFVHGNSNVANYVLARAPDLPNSYVYAHLEDRLVRETKAKMSAEGALPT